MTPCAGNGWKSERRSVAVAAELFKIDHCHAAIFQAQQALLLQGLQALVGLLARNASDGAELFLGDLQMAGRVTIEDRVEERSYATRETPGGIEPAAIFSQCDDCLLYTSDAADE